MGGAQSLLGDAGACPEVEFGGKVWRVGHPTQRAKAALEELCAAKAVAEVTALKGVLPAADYAALFQGVLAEVTGGAYRTFAPGWVRLATGPAGGVLFLLSLLRERHPDATEADAAALAAERADEVTAALARVVPPFFDLLVASATLSAPQKEAVRSALAESLRPLTTPSA